MPTQRDGAASEYLQRLATLPPIPCRDDFAQLAQQSFNLTGNAAEVGVFQGQFARKILSRWKGRYWGIDAWTFRGRETVDDKNFRDVATNEANFATARRRVEQGGDRAKLIRSLSVPAAARFADGFFDLGVH